MPRYTGCGIVGSTYKLHLTVGIVGCWLVLYIFAYYPKVYWSRNGLLSACVASYISESELSAVGCFLC